MTDARPVLDSLARQLGITEAVHSFADACLTQHREATTGREHIRVIPGHGWAIVGATLVLPNASTNAEALATDDLLALFDRSVLETAAAIVIEHDLAAPPTASSDYQQGWSDAVHHVEALLKRLAAGQHAHRYADFGPHAGSRCTACNAPEPGTHRLPPAADGPATTSNGAQ